VAARLPPIGFWSYARQDDDASQGQLSALRLQVKAELQQQYGHSPITIFQDVAAIAPGAEWEREIRNAIGRSTFLIPIITPAFIESEWCLKEVRIFLEREQQIWRHFPALDGKRRIFPVYYRSIEDLPPFDDAVLKELRKLQWVDYRELRYKNPHEEVVQKTLDHLGRGMSSLLHILAEPAPAETASPAEAPGGVEAPLVAEAADRPAEVLALDAPQTSVAKADPQPQRGPQDQTPPLAGDVAGSVAAQTAQSTQTAKTVMFDTGGASAASVVWTVARQLIAAGLVVWAVIIAMHIPGDLSSGGGNGRGEIAFVVAMLGGAGILWRAGR
jgi:hypothetical protein